MSIRTRFEIETFVLGAHPTPGRKAQALMSDLLQARAEQHPDLPVLEEVYEAFAKDNNVEELLVLVNLDVVMHGLVVSPT